MVSNIMTSMLNSANAIQIFDRQLSVTQKNVSNASTPGYARQVDTGMPGGMEVVESARSDFADDSVRRARSLLGSADQKATDLAQVENIFSLTSKSDISNQLSHFFQGFAQLAVSPNDPNARQAVIDRAASLAQSFNQAAGSLGDLSSQAGHQLQSSVTEINRIGGQIREINSVRQRDSGSKIDPDLDTRLHASLEDLSQYTNFTTLKEDNGTVTVMLGGQSPLVIGDHEFAIQADLSGGTAKVLDSTGADMTARITGGSAGALLEEHNQLVPSYLTQLNILARTVADQVNTKLAAGVDANGAAPAVDLLSYNSTTGEASSLSVTNITPDQIAAANAGSPGGNGIALDIADLVNSKPLGNFTLTQYFGNLAARAGRDLASAKEGQQTQTAAVSQARSLRDQASGVSLDSEAAHLLQIQRSYQAVGKMLNVLNDLTETIIGLIK